MINHILSHSLAYLPSVSSSTNDNMHSWHYALITFYPPIGFLWSPRALRKKSSCPEVCKNCKVQFSVQDSNHKLMRLLFVYLFICLFICLFVYLFVYLFVCLFICLFICLFTVWRGYKITSDIATSGSHHGTEPWTFIGWFIILT